MMRTMWLLLAGAGLVLYFVIHNKQMANLATPSAALPPASPAQPAVTTNTPAAGKPSANIMDYEWMGALDSPGAGPGTAVTGVIANFAPSSNPFGGGGDSGGGGSGGDGGEDMSGVGMGAAPSSGGLAESPSTTSEPMPAPPGYEYTEPAPAPTWAESESPPMWTEPTPPVDVDGYTTDGYKAPGGELPPIGTVVNAVVIRRSDIAKIMTKYGAGSGSPPSDPFAAMGEVFEAMSKGVRVTGRVYGYGKGLSKAFGGSATKSDTFTIVEVTSSVPGGPAVGSYVAVG